MSDVKPQKINKLLIAIAATFVVVVSISFYVAAELLSANEPVPANATELSPWFWVFFVGIVFFPGFIIAAIVLPILKRKNK